MLKSSVTIEDLRWKLLEGKEIGIAPAMGPIFMNLAPHNLLQGLRLNPQRLFAMEADPHEPRKVYHLGYLKEDWNVLSEEEVTALLWCGQEMAQTRRIAENLLVNGAKTQQEHSRNFAVMNMLCTVESELQGISVHMRKEIYDATVNMRHESGFVEQLMQETKQSLADLRKKILQFEFDLDAGM